MEKISFNVKRYQKQDNSKLQRFQERALEVCEQFQVKAPYNQIIFRQAKRNIQYLEGKVSLCEEKFGKDGCKNAGRYLIALFRKRKPWEK